MKAQIFSVGYRPMDRARLGGWVPWPIARTALALAWRRRATKVALMICLMVVVIHGGLLVTRLLMERVGQQAMVDNAMIGAVLGQVQELLASFVSWQFFTTMLVLAGVGGGLIAEDRRAGAMELYFSRPLTRLDYVIGKLLAAALVPTATIVLPLIILWAMAVGISPAHQADTLWWLLGPCVAGALCATIVLSTTIVGLSAMGERGSRVGVVFVMVVLGLTLTGLALNRAGYSWGGYIAPERDLRTVVDYLFGIGVRSMAGQFLDAGSVGSNAHVGGSVIGLAVLSLAGLGALAWRLKREVVG